MDAYAKAPSSSDVATTGKPKNGLLNDKGVVRQGFGSAQGDHHQQQQAETEEARRNAHVNAGYQMRGTENRMAVVPIDPFVKQCVEDKCWMNGGSFSTTERTQVNARNQEYEAGYAQNSMTSSLAHRDAQMRDIHARSRVDQHDAHARGGVMQQAESSRGSCGEKAALEHDFDSNDDMAAERRTYMQQEDRSNMHSIDTSYGGGKHFDARDVGAHHAHVPAFGRVSSASSAIKQGTVEHVTFEDFGDARDKMAEAKAAELLKAEAEFAQALHPSRRHETERHGEGRDYDYDDAHNEAQRGAHVEYDSVHGGSDGHVYLSNLVGEEENDDNAVLAYDVHGEHELNNFVQQPVQNDEDHGDDGRAHVHRDGHDHEEEGEEFENDAAGQRHAGSCTEGEYGYGEEEEQTHSVFQAKVQLFGEMKPSLCVRV
jgi:hypothetical protein